jgi:holin-like protein
MFCRTKDGFAWRRLPVLWRRRLRSHCLLQIGLIFLVWQAGELLVRWTGLPLPGSVLGLALLLGLLGTGLCSPISLRRGSRWFLAQLLLFLLPAVMSLAEHREFFGWLGCKVLAAVCLGTLIVMVTTALLIDGCYCWLLAQRIPARAGRTPRGGAHE